MKAKTLGMLFGTGLFAVSLAMGAPQQDTSQQNQGATDQTQQQTQPSQTQAQPGTTTTSQQTTTTQPPATTPGQRKLPRTASEAPLLGMLGLIALGGAAGARILNKRTA